MPGDLIGGSNENEIPALQPYHSGFDRICLRIRNAGARAGHTRAVIPVTGLATNTPAPVLPGGAATVNVGMSASLGSLLVDSKGMTLYIFTQDSPNTSSCYGSCASYWPPLLTTGAPLAGAASPPACWAPPNAQMETCR